MRTAARKKRSSSARGPRARARRRKRPAAKSRVKRALFGPVPKPKTRAEALVWAENLGRGVLVNVRGGQNALPSLGGGKSLLDQLNDPNSQLGWHKEKCYGADGK